MSSSQTHCPHGIIGGWMVVDDTILCPECALAADPVDQAGGPVVVTLGDVAPEAIEWLWHGYLPAGKLVVLDGDPGLGKSTVTLDWATTVSTGKPWPDGSGCERAGVLLLSAEDGLADTIRPRLDGAGADCEQIHAMTDVAYHDDEGVLRRRMPVLPADVPLITQTVKERGVRLVVVDVLMAYLDGGVNAHRDQDVRRALAPLAAMAERTGACVVVLRHLNKSNEGPAIYRGGGSIGITGAVRAAFLVSSDPDADPDDHSRRVLASVKMNIARTPASQLFRLVADDDVGPSRIEWLGSSPHSADQLLADRSHDEEDDDRDELVVLLTRLLTDEGGCGDAGKLTKQLRGLGYAERTIQRARRRAGITTSKTSFDGGGWVWSLPDGWETS